MIFLSLRYDTLKKVVTIALVGKYTKLEDSYLSVEHALTHAALRCRRLLNLVVSWQTIAGTQNPFPPLLIQSEVTKISISLKRQYIPAENLEEETRIRDPERFHKSWADLCKAE